MSKAPLPDSVRIGQVSLAVFQTVIFFLKSNFSDTYFVENQQKSLIHKTIASTIKIPLSLRMQRNLK